MNEIEITPYIFLDDERMPYGVTWAELPTAPWTIVRNYDQFVSTIERYYAYFKKLPEFIAFDHDLAPEHYRQSMYNPDGHYSNYYFDGTFKEKTGFDAAKWLTEFCEEKGLDIPDYIVHSMNPIGKQNIYSILESYKRMKKLEQSKEEDKQ